MNLQKAKEDFINYEKMIGSQPKTIKHYSDVIDSFLKVCRLSDSDLTLQEIYKFVEYMDNKGLSISTKANYLRHIKVFYHFLCNSSLIADKTLWSDIRVPKDSKKIVQIYDKMEIADIYNACYAVPRWLSVRNSCIISFMLDCGLRQEEVIKLTLSDVLGNSIIVHGKGRKDRIVPKGKKLQFDLGQWLFERMYLSVDTDSLFVGRTMQPITLNTIKMFFQKISKEVGYPVSSHRLRHNFATNYLMDSYEKNGWFDSYSLMVLLGHEDIKTTERY